VARIGRPVSGLATVVAAQVPFAEVQDLFEK